MSLCPVSVTIPYGFITYFNLLLLLCQWQTCGTACARQTAPGTASVYKMRLRADTHRSQITYCGSSGAVKTGPTYLLRGFNVKIFPFLCGARVSSSSRGSPHTHPINVYMLTGSSRHTRGPALLAATALLFVLAALGLLAKSRTWAAAGDTAQHAARGADGWCAVEILVMR